MKSVASSLTVDRAVKKFGKDLAVARRRRNFTQQRLADGAGVGVATVRRLEAGDPGVSLGNLAMILNALGEAERLANLIDIGRDDIGLIMGVGSLSKRIRTGRKVVVAGDDEVGNPNEATFDGSDL